MGKVIGFHVIMTYYGFWLPNDPRGSGSTVVRKEHLKPFGPATYVNSQRSVARKYHDYEVRRLAKSALTHPAVMLNGKQAKSLAKGIRGNLAKRGINCYACAILPEHIHLVVDQPHTPIDRVLIQLKAAAVHQLLVDGLHPFQARHDRGAKVPHMWATGGRHVYLFSHAHVRGRIEYVNDNPSFAGLPEQTWSFVVDYTK